jgi:DNA-binding FrmR family transcriptional regulator
MAGYAMGEDDLLARLARIELDDHLRHCVVDAVAAGGDDGTRHRDAASAAVARLVRS